MFRLSHVVLLLALALALGCSTSTRGEKMVDGFSETRETVVSAQKQLDTTLIALNILRVSQGPGLSNAFKQFKESVDNLKKEGSRCRQQAEGMRAEAESHIQAWQNEMASIKDPAIKASLESRREAVRSNFKLAQMYAQDARKAYDPFLAGCQQLVQGLSIDLSPAAVASLKPAMDRIDADGQMLGQKMSAMLRALDNMSNGVSPIGI